MITWESDAIAYFAEHQPPTKYERPFVFCEPVENGFLMAWTTCVLGSVRAELFTYQGGKFEGTGEVRMRPCAEEFLHDSFSDTKIRELRKEVRDAWFAARAAGGQLEAFRILERMVERVGFQRT